jgi:peptide/nickel transport system permease protein
MSWLQQFRQRVGRQPAAAATIAVAPGALGAEAAEEHQVFVASQWQLTWWKFRKHKLAMISGVIIILLYAVALFADIIAPANPEKVNPQLVFLPPQQVHITTPEGELTAPFVYGYTLKRDPVSLKATFERDTSKRYPVRLFVPGEPYKFLGLFDTSTRLFGTGDPQQVVHLMGTDRLGRDMFSRTVHGARVSLSIGLIGVLFSLVLGVALGGISGYYGGALDNGIQRVIEFLRSIPSIPLWMGLSAALPKDMPPLHVYFYITVILSLIGWTGLARVVRGRFLALREEDFVMAARVAGCSEARVIFRHMVPAFTSHIIASLTLAIPGTILAETALSFLGLGLRPPVNSWGVLLQEAQNIRSVALAPWLLLPALAVIVTVLAFNFFGDGLRDAADPYAS